MPGPFDWLGTQLGSLFGAPPTYTAPNVPQQQGTTGPEGGLGGLLDPRALRRDAAWQGLGALSAGLIAAGQRRPAASPSLMPQAFAAFQPAYSGALSQGYQTAAAEQQMRQREAAERTRLEQEQQWQAALQAATPAERALMQQMGQAQWAQMQGQVEAARRAPRRPQIVTNPVTGAVSVFDEDAWRRGQPQPDATPPAGGQPPAPGVAQPGQAPGQAAQPALPSSGNAVIDATLNQIRPSESGNNPAAVSRGRDGQPILDRSGQPLAGGLYQFTSPTWEGVRARHPELNLTPDGRFDAAQSHRAAQAHAADIVRDLAPYIGRRGPNGEIIDEAMLIRGAWAGGVAGVRRYIDSGGRYNPADVNGTSLGGYFTGQQLRGGGARGGAQSPAADPGMGEGGTTVTMTPGAIPPPPGTTTVIPSAQPAARQAELAQGTALIGSLARPPQAPPQAPQAQPPQARPTAAPPPQPNIPGLTQLMPGRPPPRGTPIKVIGADGVERWVYPEDAIGQPASRPGGTAPFGPGEHSQAYGVLIDPNSDPTSEVYAAAWNIVARGTPAFAPDTREGAAPGAMVPTVITPDMRRFRPPGGGSPAGASPAADGTAPPAAPQPGAPAPPSPAGTAPGTPQVLPTGPSRTPPQSAEASGRLATVQEARRNVEDFQRAVLGPRGGIDRVAIASAYANIPGTDGARLRNQVRVAIENRLRIATGQAAPASEVDAYLSMYLPTPLDNEAMVRQRLNNLHQFFTTFEQTLTGRPAVPLSPPPPPAAPTAPPPSRIIDYDAQGRPIPPRTTQ